MLNLLINGGKKKKKKENQAGKQSNISVTAELWQSIFYLGKIKECQ